MIKVKKIFKILNLEERKRAALLLFMILIMSLLEMLGVASILPFITILSNPSLLETNSLLVWLFKNVKKYGIESKNEFLLIISGAFFLLIIFSLSFKALTTYAQQRFVTMREFSISKRLLESYLRKPYSWFINRHSGDLGKNILSEVHTVVQLNILSTIHLVSNGLITFFLIILLFLVNPIITLALGLGLIVTYSVIFFLSKSLISKIGSSHVQSNQKRFTIVSEVFGYIKEVIVSAKEKQYIDLFSIPAYLYADSIAKEQTLRKIPKYLLEAVAFGSMTLLLTFLLKREGDFLLIIPTISFYAFAGYRLIPALNQLYASLIQIRFTAFAIDNVYRDLTQLDENIILSKNQFFKFEKSLNLNNIYYTYPKASKVTLKNICLNIPAKSFVGITGSTGSGKTTLIDIILGLLSPQDGTIKVDDKIINSENCKNWQRLLGYVPQQIFITDDTIAANIAFGNNKSNIDQMAVEASAKLAELHEFVINELPNGYQTVVGERGIRLSGGQRQRIGIARALYHKPKLLILDEATSALDDKNQNKIIESIRNIKNETTVILIAHRLSTLKNCDQIFVIEKGQIKEKGSYQEVFGLK